jgi:hypothetical protein
VAQASQSPAGPCAQNPAETLLLLLLLVLLGAVTAAVLALYRLL